MAMAMAMAVVRPSSSFLGRTDFFPGGVSCRKDFLIPNDTSKIKSLFWEPKKAVEPPEMYLSLNSFTSTKINAKEDSAVTEKTKEISVSVVSSILEVPSSGWDACSLDATGPEQYNPFLSHGFLSSLEESGSAVKVRNLILSSISTRFFMDLETGWLPRHIVAQDEDKNILGVIPLYLKSHSYGEYVFDHSWADAYYRYGSKYYPKLQCCVPFTPVPGPRILVRNTPYKDQVFDILVSAMTDLANKKFNDNVEAIYSILEDN
ncbi:acyl-CoA N-acyltransferase [Tanacetum coccineum]